MSWSPNERFDYAIRIILQHEGEYSNDPDDPGGETKYGITKADLIDSPIDIKDLTRIEAEHIYKVTYWDKYNYTEITSLPIATKIFDMAVNMGPMEAHVLVQRSVLELGFPVKIDGIMGPQTIKAINNISEINRQADLMRELINESKWFYEHLAEEKPELKKFLKGWLERAAW